MTRKRGGVLQPDKLVEDCTGTIKETAASVLEGNHAREKIPFCFTLETYEETSILIPLNITEEAFKLAARKLSGSSGPGGTDSEKI